MKVILLSTHSFLIFCFILVSCGNNNKETHTVSGSGKYGGIFAYNESGTIHSIFPARGYFHNEIQVISCISEPLVKMDPDMSLVPCLAESWTVSEDGKEYIFNIRQDVFFHDSDIFPNGEGRILVANDVAHCFTKACEDFPGNTVSHYFRGVLKGASKYFEGQVEEVSGIEVIDEQTLKLTLKNPYSDLLALLSNSCLGIYPSEYMTKTKGNLDFKTVGTGPFSISSFDKDKLLLLEKNQNYWGTSSEGEVLPYLSAVKITFEKDKKIIANAFKNQVLNFVPDLSKEDASIRSMGSDVIAIQKNSVMGTKFLGMYMPNEIISKKQVRRALQYSIDKQFLVDSIMHNKGIPAYGGMIPPIFSDYSSIDGIGYSLDPKSAKHSLEIAGIKDGDLNGLEIYTTNSEEDVNIANAIQKMLKDNLGVHMSVKYYHPDEYYDLIEKGEAPLFIDGYTGDYPSPDNFLYTLFYGKYLPKGDEEYSGFNIYRYKNAFFDNLLDSARQTTDQAARIEHFQRAEKMLMSDAAVIPLFYEETEYALNKSVQNFVLDPLNLFDLTEVYFTSRSSQ